MTSETIGVPAPPAGCVGSAAGYARPVSADDGDRTGRTEPRGEPTPFEQPAVGERKPGGRGRLPVGALVAVLLGVLIVIGVVLAVVATGGHGNGQTTSMGPATISLIS